MSDLPSIRAKIDALDSRLLELLNERASLAREVGEIKSREGLPIYAPDREEQLLRSLVERNKGPLRATAIFAIYREIISASLSLEKDVVIACPAPEGSPTHQAARAKFGSSVRFAFLPEIPDVFAAVTGGDVDCGVVPIDLASHGVVNQTLDELAETTASIVAEIAFDAGDSSDRNRSRFFVLGRSSNAPSGSDRTGLVLRIENKPGSLLAALGPFKELAINLNHFATRPASKGSDDLFFFVEAEGHVRDMQVADLFRELSKSCRAVKVLGSYPSSRI